MRASVLKKVSKGTLLCCIEIQESKKMLCGLCNVKQYSPAFMSISNLFSRCLLQLANLFYVLHFILKEQTREALALMRPLLKRISFPAVTKCTIIYYN